MKTQATCTEGLRFHESLSFRRAADSSAAVARFDFAVSATSAVIVVISDGNIERETGRSDRGVLR